MIPVSIRTTCLFIIVLATIPLTGCNEVEMQSQWRTKPIVMDGSRAGWPEDVQYFDKDSKILVSIMNDENNLYIRLLTRSETTKKMFLRAGFTIWIDDTGATEKNFGVQFPLARQSRMRGTMPDHKPRTGLQENLADSQYNLAILNGHGGNRQTMPIAKAAEMGISAGLSMQQSHLIYELQVPLTAAKDNRTIGIGFETGKLERPAGKGSSGGGGKGGGRGGGGRGGGGGGGKGGQHSGGRPESIEIWTKVHLAEKTTT